MNNNTASTSSMQTTLESLFTEAYNISYDKSLGWGNNSPTKLACNP